MIKDLAPAFICALLDLDHFIAAGALSIRKLTQLKEQAPFHNLLLPILIGTLYLLVRHLFPTVNYKRLFIHVTSLSLCLVVHLYRDGQRRGVALGPWRSRPIRA